ncbi:MAG: PaaI family thioesterase [Desulfobacterales bacterium]
MNPELRAIIFKAVESEPFALAMGIQLVELDAGRSVVEMRYDPDRMANLFGRAHGGAVFSLIDEAFETACQTDGSVVVALNVSVTYVAAPDGRTRLRAEAKRIAATRKTATYDIRVTDEEGRLIATCHALAYRTGKPLPFLGKDD